MPDPVLRSFALEDAKKRVNSLRYDLNQEARQQVLATVPTWFALCLDTPPGMWATSGVTLRQRVAVCNSAVLLLQQEARGGTVSSPRGAAPWVSVASPWATALCRGVSVVLRHWTVELLLF